MKSPGDTPRGGWDSRFPFERVQGGAPHPPLAVPVPVELVERIAERAAELLEARLGSLTRPSLYLTVAEAAEYIRAKPQRVYDLLSARRLTRYKDGRRVLVSRDELDGYLVSEGRNPVAPALPPLPHTRSRKGLAA